MLCDAALHCPAAHARCGADFDLSSLVSAQMTTKLLAVETPQPDSSTAQWYRLGLTPKAAQQFMLRIGFWDKWSDTTKGSYRRSKEDAWIGEPFGTSLVSYDAASAIRKWLRGHGKQGYSVCEVLQEEAWKDYKGFAGVGAADVFVSRPQSSTLESTLAHLNRFDDHMPYMHKDRLPKLATCDAALGATHCLFFWLDIFSLRLCCDDSPLELLPPLVRDIGITHLHLDGARRCLTRAFCLLEAAETIDSDGLLVCAMDRSAFDSGIRKVNIESASAAAMKESDRVWIEQRIKMTLGGHEKVDNKLKARIEQAIGWFAVYRGKQEQGPDLFGDPANCCHDMLHHSPTCTMM